jgi:hypothetical protein
MNAIIRTVWVPVLIVSLTALANQSIYANKITVTGYPVILDDRNGIFYVPNSYITSTVGILAHREHQLSFNVNGDYRLIVNTDYRLNVNTFPK